MRVLVVERAAPGTWLWDDVDGPGGLTLTDGRATALEGRSATTVGLALRLYPDPPGRLVVTIGWNRTDLEPPPPPRAPVATAWTGRALRKETLRERAHRWEDERASP